MAAGDLPKVRDRWPNVREYLQSLMDTVNALVDGRTNARGTLTLTANAATTTLTDPRITDTSHIDLEPTTANAAAERGNGTLYRSAITGGSATFTHANNAQADRAFTYEIRT